MKFFVISLLSIFFFSGCSHFRINATMCDQIASDPQAIMPEECRDYVKEDAYKAFDNTEAKKKQDKEDLIKFTQEDKEEKE